MVNIDRKIPIRFGAHYKNRTNPKESCLRAAILQGHIVFALQDGGQCFGSPSIDSYKKYGSSKLCTRGRGGPYANSVYEIPTGKNNLYILNNWYSFEKK